MEVHNGKSRWSTSILRSKTRSVWRRHRVLFRLAPYGGDIGEKAPYGGDIGLYSGSVIAGGTPGSLSAAECFTSPIQTL